MNVVKKALFVLAFFATAFSAQAIEVSFDFSVFSSGASIYPCNAGIKHAKAQEVVCYKRTNTQQSCNPNSCEQGQSCDCVCSGEDGSYLTDFAAAKYTNWTDHNQNYPHQSSSAKIAADGSKNFIFKNNVDNNGAKSGNYFDKQLSSLSFNLGSELFGAEYYLDVCFRGPQIDYATAGISTNWVAEAEATINDMTGGYSSYAAVAGLNVTSEIVCDYQQAYNPNPLNYVPGSNAFSGNYSEELISNQSLGYSTAVAYGTENITGHGAGKAPTFCRVRYSFTEGNGLSGKDLFRPWKTQAAKVCTRTSIEDPAL